jgi:hypothetical protein
MDTSIMQRRRRRRRPHPSIASGGRSRRSRGPVPRVREAGPAVSDRRASVTEYAAPTIHGVSLLHFPTRFMSPAQWVCGSSHSKPSSSPAPCFACGHSPAEHAGTHPSCLWTAMQPSMRTSLTCNRASACLCIYPHRHAALDASSTVTCTRVRRRSGRRNAIEVAHSLASED